MGWCRVNYIGLRGAVGVGFLLLSKRYDGFTAVQGFFSRLVFYK
jgi:hypothetical protein